MFTGACKKLTGNELAADCQLFTVRSTNNFTVYDQAGSATSSKDCLRFVDGRDYNSWGIINKFWGKQVFV